MAQHLRVGMRVFATWKGQQYPAVIRNIDTAVQVEWLDWKYDNVAWVGVDEMSKKRTRTMERQSSGAAQELRWLYRLQLQV